MRFPIFHIKAIIVMLFVAGLIAVSSWAYPKAASERCPSPGKRPKLFVG